MPSYACSFPRSYPRLGSWNKFTVRTPVYFLKICSPLPDPQASFCLKAAPPDCTITGGGDPKTCTLEETHCNPCTLTQEKLSAGLIPLHHWFGTTDHHFTGLPRGQSIILSVLLQKYFPPFEDRVSCDSSYPCFHCLVMADEEDLCLNPIHPWAHWRSWTAHYPSA